MNGARVPGIPILSHIPATVRYADWMTDVCPVTSPDPDAIEPKLF